jgi:hypothetical protein
MQDCRQPHPGTADGTLRWIIFEADHKSTSEQGQVKVWRWCSILFFFSLLIHSEQFLNYGYI